MAKKYVKKPIPVEAIQIEQGLDAQIKLDEFLGNANVSCMYSSENITVIIHTLEGNMAAHLGDYIIKGVKGEFYPCRKDIFEETYVEQPETN